MKNSEKTLYICNYCTDNTTCEYAWDPYNKERTIDDALTQTCLACK